MWDERGHGAALVGRRARCPVGGGARPRQPIRRPGARPGLARTMASAMSSCRGWEPGEQGQAGPGLLGCPRVGHPRLVLMETGLGTVRTKFSTVALASASLGCPFECWTVSLDWILKDVKHEILKLEKL